MLWSRVKRLAWTEIADGVYETAIEAARKKLATSLLSVSKEQAVMRVRCSVRFCRAVKIWSAKNLRDETLPGVTDSLPVATLAFRRKFGAPLFHLLERQVLGHE